MQRFLLSFLLLGFSFQLAAQSALVPVQEDYYSLIDRYELKAGKIITPIFTSVRPWNREAIAAFLDSTQQYQSSAADKFNFSYLRADSWEFTGDSSNATKPLLKSLYRKRADFYHVQEPNFDLHVNPVLYVGGGIDQGRDEKLFVNTRGLELRGRIDNRLAFYTYVGENQAVLPSYVWDAMAENPVIPHEGFWKVYKGNKGVDYFQARGHIDFKVLPSLNVQFGHDRTFIGNGYRSLVLSDYAPPAWFLRGNLKIWKLNYLFQLNQYTALPIGTRDSGSLGSSKGYPQKFVAFHHLSINLGKKLNVGFFESVVFSPEDSLGTGQFQLNYLNPVIFYRAIEQQNGSSDNVLLGADFRWHVAPKWSIYGQFILDEFVISNIRAGNGWWANKFAVQGGFKYVDVFGISNLDIQGEVNIARPYTYSHNTNYGSYTSYNQPLAHPLGANFTEAVGILRYQPIPALRIMAKAIIAKAGRDTTGVNWGGDLLKLNNRLRPLEFGNTIGQGVEVKTVFTSLDVTWQVKHNLFLEGSLIARRSTSPVPVYNKNTIVAQLSLRLNIARRLYEF